MQEYLNIQRTFDDVADVLYELKDLRPRTDVYSMSPLAFEMPLMHVAYENGRSRLLLLLHGTIPVIFRGSSYNIPIHIWLPQEYPRASPLIFVAPSPGMGVRPGNYVDIDRRCYHPYLAYWSDDVRKSVLVDAIKNLQDVFGKEPPLYALASSERTKAAPSQASNGSVSVSNPNALRQTNGAPPVPSKIGHRNNQGNNSIKDDIRPPVSASSTQPPDYNTRPPPPLPSQASIPITSTFQTHSQAGVMNGGNQPASLNRQANGLRYSRDATSVAQHRDLLSDDVSVSTTSRRSDPTPKQKAQSMAAHVNLALETMAQKSHNEFLSQLNSMDEYLNQLKEIEDRLQTNASQMRRMDELSKGNENILQEGIQKAKRVIQETELVGPPDIDDCIVAQNVVYNQLYDLVAEELALEDTVYALGKALECERIDLDTFLKVIFHGR